MKYDKNKWKKDDEYETPIYAVEIINKYIKPESRILCPFDKKSSNFVKYFKKVGHDVVYSHIDYGQDFFNLKLKSKFDYIISNPPFSKKTQVLQKLVELNVPFAMLLNASNFYDSKIRFEIANKYKFHMIYVYPRIAYIKDGKQTTGNMFQSGFLCYKIIDEDKFETYDKNRNLKLEVIK